MAGRDEHLRSADFFDVDNYPDIRFTTTRVEAKGDALRLLGTITMKGLTTNIDVGIQYLEAWLSGNGAVPLYNLMEDAATAEISRTQIWQWLRHRAAREPGVLRALARLSHRLPFARASRRAAYP